MCAQLERSKKNDEGRWKYNFFLLDTVERRTETASHQSLEQLSQKHPDYSFSEKIQVASCVHKWREVTGWKGKDSKRKVKVQFLLLDMIRVEKWENENVSVQLSPEYKNFDYTNYINYKEENVRENEDSKILWINSLPNPSNKAHEWKIRYFIVLFNFLLFFLPIEKFFYFLYLAKH